LFGNACYAIHVTSGEFGYFSKRALKSLNNQAGFDSAIRMLIRCGQKGHSKP
jgi:hypothetical protein